MSTKLYLVLLFCVFALKIQAQDRLSLKQCIDFGLKSNPSNFIYENEKRIADAKAKEILADYLPALDASGSIDNNLKVQEQIIPAGLFGDEDMRVAFTKQFNTNGTLQLNQNIYDQSAITGLKANKINKQRSILNKEKNNETIIYNISTAYYQIYTYLQQLDLLKTNMETYGKQLEIVGLKVKKGVVLQKDLDKVQVDYNNLKSQIRVAETNIELATNQLKYEMGFPMDEHLEIERTMVSIEPESFSLGNDELEIENLTDYQLDKNNADLLKIDQKQIKAGYLPKISAYARLGVVGFGDNLSQSFSTLNSFSAVGLKLSMSLFDGFRRSNQYKQAQFKYNNALEQNKLNEGKYKLEFENSKSKLLKSQSNFENDRRNMELAQSVFEVTDLQYQKGVTDMTDWLNSQRSLKEAQNSYLGSFYDYLQSQIDIEKSKGTLNQFYNSL